MSQKQPGSQHQRQYASKLLRCSRVDETTWRVWGGKDEHIVKNMQCDCWQAVTNKKICAHVIRVLMGETV